MLSHWKRKVNCATHLAVCVSTQSGCELGCRFCAIAALGLRHNMTSAEIVGQILRAGDLVLPGQRVTNLVLMRMGESLQNYDEVKNVLEMVGADRGLDISHKRTTVSTVSLVPAIYRWIDDKIKADLAISLVAADDELSSELTPINRRCPLAELKKAAFALIVATGRRITFECTLMENVNGATQHAKKIVHFIGRIPCKINRIRFHPHPGSPYRRLSQDRVNAFRDYLYPRCPTVTVRRSFGLDIRTLAGRALLSSLSPCGEADVRLRNLFSSCPQRIAALCWEWPKFEFDKASLREG